MLNSLLDRNRRGGWSRLGKIAALLLMTMSCLPTMSTTARADTAGNGKIVISGASGQLGAETIKILLQRGVKPQDLILLSRTPEKLQSLAAQGASVRHADFDEPASLPAALAGGQIMLLISTDKPGPKRVQGHVAAIDAAKQAGIGRIVYTSVVNSGDRSTEDIFADHLKTERALRDSGVKWTILRNAVYADLELAAAAQAVQYGQYVTNRGDGKVTLVTRHDCAIAAAAALMSHDQQDRLYNITGPALLTAADIAAAISKVSGKPVKAVIVDDATFTDGFVKAGLPAQLAQMFTTVGVAIRRGSAAIKTSDFTTLTGAQPTSFEDFLVANRDKLMGPPPVAAIRARLRNDSGVSTIAVSNDNLLLDAAAARQSRINATTPKLDDTRTFVFAALDIEP